MCRKIVCPVALYTAFILFILTVISAWFPVQTFQKTIFSSGDAVGVLDPLGNGDEVEQRFHSDYPVNRISFRLATYMEELKSGRMDVRVWDAEKEKILLTQTISSDAIKDNSFIHMDVELQPGTYYLSFSISELEADKHITFYTAANAANNFGEFALNGEPSQDRIYLSITTNQETASVPQLAFVLLGLTVLGVVITKDWWMLGITALEGVLCALTVGIVKCFPTGDVNYRWIVMPLCSVFLFAGLAVYVQKKAGIVRVLQSACSWLRNRRRSLLKLFLLTAVSLAGGAAVEGGYSLLKENGFLAVRWLFFTSIIWVGGYHILFWKQIRRNLPRSFLIAAMAAGLVMCISMPIVTLVGWDDEIHFSRSVFLAGGNSTIFSQGETMLSNREIPVSFSMETVRQQRISMEDGAATGTLQYKSDAWSLLMIGYLPYVIGRWIGQILSVPFWCTLVISRMVNVVCYVLVMYAAMKRLKSGQLVVYVLGMLPTGLFLAATYSYDSWVNCLTILGFSYFVGAMQRIDEPLTAREMWIMLSALVIGCIPKAIYAMMIPLLLLMPKDKFREQGERRRYVWFVLAATAVGILVYAVPFLMRGAFASSSDYRGGSDVNAVEQVKYILLHPVQYADTLLRFLRGYLSPENSYGYISFFAYLGGKDVHTIVFTILFAAALTDRGPSDLYYRNCRVMLGSAVWIFVTLCAVATALYISFTPVGLGTINGCQPRYLIPVLFPLLMLSGNIQTASHQEQKPTNYVLSGLSACILFFCIWETMIQQYTL